MLLAEAVQQILGRDVPLSVVAYDGSESRRPDAVATLRLHSPDARVWRLYMAASAVGFERHRLEVHQVLATRTDRGQSSMPLRPVF